MSEIVFTNGETEYKIRELTKEDYAEATKVYNRTFSKNLDNEDIPLKEDISKMLRKRNLWDDEKQTKLDTVLKEIEKCEKKLKGKNQIKRSQATSISIELKKLRSEMLSLLSILNQFDNITVEGLAENERFNYLVSASLVYNSNGKRVFKDLDEYNSRATEPFAYEAAKKLMEREFSFIKTLEAELIENKILKKLGKVDDKFRLINEDGHLVDENGKLIDEDGNYVAYDKDGQQYRVNSSGKKIEQDTFDIDAVEFIDG